MTPKKTCLRRKDVDEATWIKHKKLCKKRASAKWYLKKRQRELEALYEEEQKRKTEEAHLRNGDHPLWTPLQKMEWQCALEHKVGWPARPDTIPPEHWLTLVAIARASLDHMMQHEWQETPDPERQKALCRGLLMAELRKTYFLLDGDIEALKNRVTSPPVLQPQTQLDAVAEPPQSRSWFPIFGSALGLAFVRLVMNAQTELWPALLSCITNNQVISDHNMLHSAQSHCEHLDSRNHMAPIQTPTAQDNNKLFIIAGKE